MNSTFVSTIAAAPFGWRCFFLGAFRRVTRFARGLSGLGGMFGATLSLALTFSMAAREPAAVRERGKPDYSDIWQVYTFSPSVTPTTYHSGNAGATIIWLDGLADYYLDFGEIWHVYSFSPRVDATAYESVKGGATIIWISGMDDEKEPERKARF
ncbi:MAG: hypothetical protein HY360_04905 [Verrucomicrobia bacterium]|nr:hypothetical protein [Verrucomicrobiota bacterium]